jgi:membrane associated rhomboid family serine protease
MNPHAPREKLLNVPPVLVWSLGALLLVHVVRQFLSQTADVEFLLLFAFIPARYDENILAGVTWPGGSAADVWTFVTYALIHGDWLHLGFNAVWLVAFGTPLARRFGPARFLAFCAVTAAAGALLHLMTHFGQMVPMVGASAAISGTMSGAMRFAFQRGGPLRLGGAGEDDHVPALPLRDVLRDTRVLAFIAVWFGLNLLFGLGTIPLAGENQSIAWEAHVGGFVAGLLLFGWFDPVKHHQYR